MADLPEVAEAFNTWTFDTASGGWRDINAPLAPPRSLFELSEGLYDVQGSTVRDTASGRIVANLSSIHGSSLNLGDQGSIFLNNGIAREEVNRAGGRNIMQRAAITVTIPGEAGAEATVISGTTSLTHFGGGIYTIFGNPRGPADFERVDVVPDTQVLGEPRRLNLPLSIGLYRRATPSEVLNRSIAGWLARNAFDAIAERIAGLGGKNYVEEVLTILDAIAQLGITVEVAPFVTYDLSGGE